MSGVSRAPWTPEQVEKLNDWQTCGWVHPFTCLHRERNTHPTITEGDFGVLIATEQGWVCPDCAYQQDWCHHFMLKGPPPNPLESA